MAAKNVSASVIGTPEPAAGPAAAAEPQAAPVEFKPTGPARLSVAPPAGSLTVDDIVIGREPVDVDSETAARAREAAWLAGINLKEH
jgi:hypothetical protein